MTGDCKFWRLILGLSAVYAFFVATDITARADDELAKSASWQIPSFEKIQMVFSGWLDEIEADANTKTRVQDSLKTSFESDRPIDRLDAVLLAIQAARPELGPLLDQTKTTRDKLFQPDFSAMLDSSLESDFVRDHVRLLYGRWLARNELLDESLAELELLNIHRVLDPATLLFYRALAQHQLLHKDECLDTIKLLLENEKELPHRYSKLGKLMAADISPLEDDSLDEISRMMKDIRRRQGLYRSGLRVRRQEEDVINKLDKLIEKIENQQQQQQQQLADGSTPGNPMQDSNKASGRGTGDVVGKPQLDSGEWGSLPPAERAAVLAEMAKDLPPHYRAVIEEYFRKLAGEDR